jgi:hypothetical protein
MNVTLTSVLSVSSDPHAYLRPLYRELARDRSFALLAVETRFDRLIEAVAKDDASKAAHMREYTHAARVALLGHLEKMESQRPMPREVRVWVLRKDQRELTCVARYLPSGIDVCLEENGDMRRTQLVKDGPHAEQLADEWQDAAQKLGWKPQPPRNGNP